MNLLMKRFSQIFSKPKERAMVLLYHRITETVFDPLLLTVKPANFKEHLDYLSQNYQILSLRELKESLRVGKIIDKTVVITFDDGYADNFYNAKPLLEKYNIPATIFVTTKEVKEGQEFWWDTLEKLIFWSVKLPKNLKIKIENKVYQWDLGEWAELLSMPTFDSDYWHWNIRTDFFPTSRHKIYKELYTLLRPLEEEKRQKILNDLFYQISLEEKNYHNWRVLSPKEISLLAENDLIEIGSHSLTHSVLTKRTLEVQHKEVVESKQYLEEILNKPVKSFSYPYGSRNDIGSAHQLLKEAGYEIGCANFPDFVISSSNPFLLPRFVVRDWNGKEFAYQIEKFFKN